MNITRSNGSRHFIQILYCKLNVRLRVIILTSHSFSHSNFDSTKNEQTKAEMTNTFPIIFGDFQR